MLGQEAFTTCTSKLSTQETSPILAVQLVSVLSSYQTHFFAKWWRQNLLSLPFLCLDPVNSRNFVAISIPFQFDRIWPNSTKNSTSMVCLRLQRIPGTFISSTRPGALATVELVLGSSPIIAMGSRKPSWVTLLDLRHYDLTMFNKYVISLQVLAHWTQVIPSHLKPSQVIKFIGIHGFFCGARSGCLDSGDQMWPRPASKDFRSACCLMHDSLARSQSPSPLNVNSPSSVSEPEFRHMQPNCCLECPEPSFECFLVPISSEKL